MAEEEPPQLRLALASVKVLLSMEISVLVSVNGLLSMEISALAAVNGLLFMEISVLASVKGLLFMEISVLAAVKGLLFMEISANVHQTQGLPRVRSRGGVCALRLHQLVHHRLHRIGPASGGSGPCRGILRRVGGNRSAHRQRAQPSGGTGAPAAAEAH